MKHKATKPDSTELAIDHTKHEFAETQLELADIYVQLTQYELGYEYLIMAKQFYEDTDSCEKKDENYSDWKKDKKY